MNNKFSTNTTGEAKKHTPLVRTSDGYNYLVPFLVVTLLFFLWGFAHSILDVLNKHFQESFEISKARSGMVQAVVYGGYFLMALPAGKIISRYGYRTGVIVGLLLYGLGALLFVPGEHINDFYFFLMSLFIIGCGLTCLETAANPYVTVLGEPESSERRLNVAQSLNGLGWIVGPLVGGLFVFQADGGQGSLSMPYAIIGVLVIITAALFSRIKLPEIKEDAAPHASDTTQTGSLFRKRNFVWGVIALFSYVAAQTGINSFFINYVTEPSIGLDNRTAAVILSIGGMGLFMLGRLIGSWLMMSVAPLRILTYATVGAIFTMCLVVSDFGWPSAVALFVCYLCESIMFPTIFSLSLRGAKGHTKIASSILIMSIVGGAISPVMMGFIADYSHSVALSFLLPLGCFIVIYLFSSYIYDEKKNR